MAGLPVEAVAAGGGAVVAIVAAATLLLRRRRAGARIDGEAAAIDGASALLPGFTAQVAVVGHDGAAALVGGTGADGHGRLVLLHARVRRLAAREIDWPAVRATPGGIVVETGERRGGGVAIVGVDALDVRRLAPAASAEAIRIAERLAPPAGPDEALSP